MTCGIGRGRAKLRRALNRADVNGCIEIVGDEWLWHFSIIDTELANSTLKFTAKYCVEDPDASAPIALMGDSSTKANVKSPGTIVVYTSSNDGRMDGIISVPPAMTAAIDVIESTKTSLYFDLQVTRATSTNSPQVQTYFRDMNSRLYAMKDITNG